jgi:hypothetical protein
MSRVKYHREQAKVLTALAMFADDSKKARMYNMAVIEHLERAEELERAELVSPEIGNTAFAARHGKAS